MTLHNYKIWTNDGLIEKEDAKEIWHVNPQAAVEEFAETYDRNKDFYFAHRHNGRTAILNIIFVEDEKGYITKWDITVEAVPQYYATEVK